MDLKQKIAEVLDRYATNTLEDFKRIHKTEDREIALSEIMRLVEEDGKSMYEQGRFDERAVFGEKVSK